MSTLKIRTQKTKNGHNKYRTTEYNLQVEKSVCQKLLKNWKRILYKHIEKPVDLLLEYPASTQSLTSLTESLRQGCKDVMEQYPHLPLPDNWQKPVYSNEDLNILHDGFVEVCREDIKQAEATGTQPDQHLLHLLEVINIGVHKIESKMLFDKTDQTPPYIQSIMCPEYDSFEEPLTPEEAQQFYDVTYSTKNSLIIANQILGKSLENCVMDNDYKSLTNTEHETHLVPKLSIKTGFSAFITKTHCDCCGQFVPYHLSDQELNDSVKQQMIDWCKINRVHELGIDVDDPYWKPGRMIIGSQSNVQPDDFAWFTEEDCVYTVDRFKFESTIITGEFYYHEGKWLVAEEDLL